MIRLSIIMVFERLILTSTDFYHLFLRFLLSFSHLDLRYIKHSRQCFSTFLNTSRLDKNTPLRLVSSTLFSRFTLKYGEVYTDSRV